MEEILLDDLHAIRDRLLDQMMQALAAQYGMGSLQRLNRRSLNRLRRDVMGHIKEFDLFVEATDGEIKPRSPFDALMVQWLAVNADIEELESFESASWDFIEKK